MFARKALLCVCAAGIAVLFGCGGSSGGGGTTATGGSSGGDFDTRSALYTVLNDKYVFFAPRSDPTQRPAMIAFALSLPEIESAGWTDPDHGDNFYAILKDGSPYTILDNLGQPTDPPLVPIAFGPTRVTKIVPASTKARLYYSLGDAFNNNVPALQSLLTPVGYKTVTGTGHLEELTTQVKGDGYFYWMTHSGWLVEKGVQVPIISTSELYTKLAHDSDFIRNLYDEGVLTVSAVTNNKRAIPVDLNSDGKITSEEELDYNIVYAIRPAFIKKYFQFSANSVIMQESCTSGDPVFRDAYLAAKAGAYVGWSSVTRPGLQMPLLTDRLLGGNVLKPLDSPPERPFDFLGVMAWMQSKGYDLDGDGSRLMASYPSGSNAGILAPSIRSMQINELHLLGKPSLLVISGTFGPRDDTKYKREVVVNGIQLKIVDGNDTSITAEIPETGISSAGPCVVVIGGRISNEVPISLYTLKMNYTFLGPGTMKVVDTITYKIRLDVHQNRGAIDTEPSGDVAFFFGRSDSTASFVASGTGDVNGCTHTWAGTGSITTATTLGNPFTIDLTGEYDRATGKFPSFQPIILFKPTDGTTTVQCPGPGGPVTEPGGILNIVSYDSDPQLEIDLDTYAIQPGSVKYTTNPIGVGTLSWQLCTPQYPPTDKTKA
jgi:hypothetical protein